MLNPSDYWSEFSNFEKEKLKKKVSKISESIKKTKNDFKFFLFSKNIFLKYLIINF